MINVALFNVLINVIVPMIGYAVDAAMLIGSDERTVMCAVHRKYPMWKKERVSQTRSGHFSWPHKMVEQNIQTPNKINVNFVSFEK